MTADRVIWCEHAWLGPERGVAHGVAVSVAQGLIDGVEVGVAEVPAGAVRHPGLTLPGLVNAHSHAFHRALRGRTHGGTGTFWTWRDRMYELAARLDPDRYHRLARAVFGEMLVAGYTSVGEFHYLHHGPGGARYSNVNAMGEAVVAAAADAGIRLTLLDTCYLHGGFGAPPNEVQLRFADRDVDDWAERAAGLVDGPLVRIGAAAHSVRAVDPRSARVVAEWAAARSAVVHAHVSEQPAEVEQCRAAHGTTPISRLVDDGLVSDRFTAVHATHATDAELGELARAGGVCCVCPTTERDLADGIGPTGMMRDLGLAMALGSDSHAVVDPFEEARALEHDERLRTLRRGNHGADALLDAATSGGARSLGWPDAGRIEPGAVADLTTVSLRSVRLAGSPVGDLAAAVVFGATAADVDQVVVGGRTVVAGGHHVSFDVAAELDSAIGDLWS